MFAILRTYDYDLQGPSQLLVKVDVYNIDAQKS